ncbi:MAG: dephospho-CoA kinase [Deltaproteobacteria bacterium]|nr:dephospho-CoA kinase [Deltaproteobacteria bacterium]
MRLVGLTGGIGSGKSAVAALLRARGIPVFDADQAAREATAPGSPGLAAVVAEFGPDTLLPDGTLDRAAMARRVFADPTARGRLERLLHPRVDAAAAEWLAARAAEGHALCVYEAALVFETGREAWLDGVVAVLADIETRVRRVVARDGVAAEAVRARVAVQLDDAERRRRARWVVVNDGTLAELERRVEVLAGELSFAPSQDGAR